MAIEEILSIIDKASAPLRGVATEANRTKSAFNDVYLSADEVDRSISRTGQNAAKFRGILSTVNPMLGELAGFANDAFDGLEVIGASSSMLGPAFAALVGAMIPVGANLAVMARESDEAAARVAFLADHLHDLDQALRTLEDAQLAAAVATRAMTQAQADQQEIQIKAGRAVDDFRTSQEKERAAAEASFFASEKWLNRMEVLPGFLSTAIDYYAGFTSAQQEATKTLDALDATELRHQEIVVETAKADEAATSATHRRAAAVQALSRAEAELAGMEEFRARVTKAIAERISDYTDINAGLFAVVEDQGLSALRDFGAVLEDVVPSAAMSDLDRLAMAEADLVMAFSRGAIELDAYTAATDRLAASRLALADATAKANTDSAIRSTSAGVTGGPEAGVNALGEAGPWGELLASLIEMVTNLADTLGGFQDYHNQLMTAIGSLPQTLADNMGSIFSDSFATIIPDFVDSFTEAFPEIIGGIIGGIAGVTSNLLISMMIELPIALVKGILSIFTADFWIGIGESIAEAFTGIFKGSDTLDTVAAGARSSSGMSKSGAEVRDAASPRGSYDTGTSYVPETGLYQLHKGEEVINPTGMGTSRQEAMRGRVTSSRLGSSATGMVVHATIQLDSGALEQGLQDMRSRGYGV